MHDKFSIIEWFIIQMKSHEYFFLREESGVANRSTPFVLQYKARMMFEVEF